MHIQNPFRKQKIEPKPELKPDYIELLLNLAARVETLEKHIAKLHTKQSPGRPTSTFPDYSSIVIGGKEYKVPPSIR